MPLLRLHSHQSYFVANSVNEDILLVENDFKELPSCEFSIFWTTKPRFYPWHVETSWKQPHATAPHFSVLFHYFTTTFYSGASPLLWHFPWTSVLANFWGVHLYLNTFPFSNTSLFPDLLYYKSMRPFYSKTSPIFQCFHFISTLPLYFSSLPLFQCFHFISTLPLYFNASTLFQHSLFISMFSFYSNTPSLPQCFHFIPTLSHYFNASTLFQHSPFISMFSFYSNTPPLFQCFQFIPTLPLYSNVCSLYQCSLFQPFLFISTFPLQHFSFVSTLPFVSMCFLLCTILLFQHYTSPLLRFPPCIWIFALQSSSFIALSK